MAYTAAITKQFTQTYYELLGSLGSSNDDVTRMYNDYLACPTAGSIESFIRESSEFAKKHRQLVVKVHGLVCNHNLLTEENINRLVKRFVDDASYNVDKLRDTIMCMENEVQRDAAGLVLDDLPEVSDNDPVQESDPVVPESDQIVPVSDYAVDQPYLSLFEKEFERPMFVQEYFAYKKMYPTVDELAAILPEKHARFTDIYIAARQSYLNFLNKGLGMHDFVCRHLMEFEDDGFMTRLADTMIASEDYTECMKEKLAIMYWRMYHEELHQDDFEHLIKRLRAKSMPLAHDGLSKEVSDFRSESIALGERVDACFHSVLRRAAEQNELAEQVRVFRSMIEDGRTECDASLRRRLITSLEFHDVVKEMIRDALYCAEGGRQDASISQKYAALTAVLSKIKETDDLPDVVNHVVMVVENHGKSA